MKIETLVTGKIRSQRDMRPKIKVIGSGSKGKVNDSGLKMQQAIIKDAVKVPAVHCLNAFIA